jgi:diguanylate cyclase (GGDEF)-like protein
MDPEAPRYADPLTGLGDRRAFDDALAAAAAKSSPVSLVVVELDRIADIRIGHGPQRSDRALKEAASALSGAIRATGDACFRWRDDGFAVLLPHTGGYEAEEIAGRLADAVRENCKRPDGTPLTATCGAAQLAEREARFDLIEAADAALRAQKARGSMSDPDTPDRMPSG